MRRIYLDNAATTPLLPEVITAMAPFAIDKFGNPNSIYSFGREARLSIETARKGVAKYLNAKPSEVFFTSGGTESTNTVIQSLVLDAKITTIISSAIEHHATLHAAAYWAKKYNLNLILIPIKSDGHLDYAVLETSIKNAPPKQTLVTLMYANNEIGNLLQIEKVGAWCKANACYFHTDAVQGFGKYPINVQALNIDFLSASAHKFYGPKGVGILYKNEHAQLQPLILGGAQERNFRAGTENVSGIVGLNIALNYCIENMQHIYTQVAEIKHYFMQLLQEHITGVSFIGDAKDGLFTVLSVAFLQNAKTEMLIYNLDIEGICASGGSACSSGANNASHVILAVKGLEPIIPIRFSFSKYTTKQEIETTIAIIKKLIQ